MRTREGRRPNAHRGRPGVVLSVSALDTSSVPAWRPAARPPRAVAVVAAGVPPHDLGPGPGAARPQRVVPARRDRAPHDRRVPGEPALRPPGASRSCGSRTPATLPGTGALTSLSADETPNRKVIAGWTCTGTGCAASTARRGRRTTSCSRRSTSRRCARGPIELRVDGGLLADTTGAAIGTVVGAHDLRRRQRRLALRRARHALVRRRRARSARHARRPLDVNHDGRVTPARRQRAHGRLACAAAESGASCPDGAAPATTSTATAASRSPTSRPSRTR